MSAKWQAFRVTARRPDGLKFCAVQVVSPIAMEDALVDVRAFALRKMVRDILAVPDAGGVGTEAVWRGETEDLLFPPFSPEGDE